MGDYSEGDAPDPLDLYGRPAMTHSQQAGLPRAAVRDASSPHLPCHEDDHWRRQARLVSAGSENTRLEL